MKSEIKKYLSKFDLDIRKSKDARYVDQKCTPDVVSFIADCVTQILPSKSSFCISDIWESQYFAKNTEDIFKKPRVDDENAKNEYNKVLSQPLKLLAYAHILKVCKVERTLIFSVENQELLDYIAIKDRNAYTFLCCYFKKVMSDTDFLKHFDEYASSVASSGNDKSEIKSARNRLYTRYCMLIKGHTKTKSETDIRRMFHKVFNVYASEKMLPDSKGKVRYFTDLGYNETNPRDVGKPKNVPRKGAKLPKKAKAQNGPSDYQVRKAMAVIKKKYSSSEVHDSWSKGRASQVHHIFPRASFPQVAHYTENLIALTPTQHFTKAHPNNQTQLVDKDYQLTCLLSKVDSIEKSIQQESDMYYRKESFIHVLNEGLSEKISERLTFNQIKTRLQKIYNP